MHRASDGRGWTAGAGRTGGTRTRRAARGWSPPGGNSILVPHVFGSRCRSQAGTIPPTVTGRVRAGTGAGAGLDAGAESQGRIDPPATVEHGEEILTAGATTSDTGMGSAAPSLIRTSPACPRRAAPRVFSSNVVRAAPNDAGNQTRGALLEHTLLRPPRRPLASCGIPFHPAVGVQRPPGCCEGGRSKTWTKSSGRGSPDHAHHT